MGREVRQINPTGNIPLPPSGKSPVRLRASHPMRGALRNVTNARWDAVDVMARFDETRCSRTAKSCGPGAAVLALSLVECFREATVATKPFTGDHEVSRNHCAGKAGLPPLDLYARVRFFSHKLHTRPRVQRAPGFPCALFASGGRNEMQSSGGSCRENADSHSSRCLTIESENERRTPLTLQGRVKTKSRRS